MKWHRCMGRRTWVHKRWHIWCKYKISCLKSIRRINFKFSTQVRGVLTCILCPKKKTPLEFSSNKNWDFQHGGGGGGEENEEKCCLYSWSSVCYVNLGIWPTMFQVSIENRRTVMRLMHSDRWYQPLVRGTVIGDCSILNYLPHLSSHS